MDEKQLQKFARRISKEADPVNNQALIPAATVVLLRDGADGMETLMLRKNSKIAFAGMWAATVSSSTILVLADYRAGQTASHIN